MIPLNWVLINLECFGDSQNLSWVGGGTIQKQGMVIDPNGRKPVGLTLTQQGLIWQNQPVPPNWFSSAESQVGWGGPKGLDPKVDPTFLSECVSSAGTEPFLLKKKASQWFFLPTNPYMVMNCIFLASHVHL
jgi:hypothetical protein